jgi:hypothetical protein
MSEEMDKEPFLFLNMGRAGDTADEEQDRCGDDGDALSQEDADPA